MQAFDGYRQSYERVVENSIAFSGLKHDFFLEAKALALEALFARHFGGVRPALLDVGCGVGRLHPLLARLTASVSGADVSTESLARARIDSPAVDYRDMRAGRLPWDDGAVDVTLAVCVLHHVPIVERDAFLSEMVRVTRRGGLVVVIEHNPWNPLTRLAVARCPFDHDAVLLRHGEASSRLGAAGVSRIETAYFLLAPTLAAPVRQIEHKLARLPLGAQYMTSGVA